MRASEQERIDVSRTHGLEQSLCENRHLRARCSTTLDEFDEPGTRCAHEIDSGADSSTRNRPVVRAGPDRSDRADDSDRARARGSHQGICSRLDDPQNGNVPARRRKFGLEFVDRKRCSCGVARHDDRLGSVFFDQTPRQFTRVLTHIRQRFVTVGVPTRIADVNDVFARQEVDHGPRNRQAAESGIEKTDGSRVRVASCHVDTIDDGRSSQTSVIFAMICDVLVSIDRLRNFRVGSVRRAS